MSAPERNNNKVSTLESDALFLAPQCFSLPHLNINCLMGFSGLVASDKLLLIT